MEIPADQFKVTFLTKGRRDGLVVTAHACGSSGASSSPGREYGAVLLGKTVYSYSVFLRPGE